MSNKLNSHRYIVRLPVRETRCKRSPKGDGAQQTKHSGLVFALLWRRLLHTTENICADVPQRTNNTTMCALCERGKKNKKKPQSQGDDFNLRLQSTHTHTHTVEKHRRIQEFGGGGGGCALASVFVCWSRTNTLIWMQRG